MLRTTTEAPVSADPGVLTVGQIACLEACRCDMENAESGSRCLCITDASSFDVPYICGDRGCFCPDEDGGSR